MGTVPELQTLSYFLWRSRLAKQHLLYAQAYKVMVSKRLEMKYFNLRRCFISRASLSQLIHIPVFPVMK